MAGTTIRHFLLQESGEIAKRYVKPVSLPFRVNNRSATTRGLIRAAHEHEPAATPCAITYKIKCDEFWGSTRRQAVLFATKEGTVQNCQKKNGVREGGRR